MKILEKGVKNLAKKSEKFSEGIDYLRVKIPLEMSPGILKYFDKIINSVDSDNSNIFIDDVFEFPITWNKVNLTTGPALIGSIVYHNQSIPCFCYNEFHENNKKLFNGYGRFDFYGQFFRLKEVSYVTPKFYQFFFKIFKDCPVTRLDYRYDFFNYQGDLFLPQEIVSLSTNTPIDNHTTGGISHSWKAGSKISYNWLVRAYDKKKDTAKKGKFLLYGDYHQFDFVYRLEFEFLNHWTKGFLLGDLKALLLKCKNHINFKPLGCERYVSSEKLDLSNEYDRIAYIQRTKGYTKALILNEVNMFDLLEQQYLELGFTTDEIIHLQRNLLSYKKMIWTLSQG